jgi:uncharacterized membrane protein YoaK (UPF0700 family)
VSNAFNHFNKHTRGLLMNRKQVLLNAAAFVAFSTVLTAAQMQTPASSKAEDSSAAPTVLTGTLSDSMCGAQHMEKGKSAAECTRECVKGGTKYALVVGEESTCWRDTRPNWTKLPA